MKLQIIFFLIGCFLQISVGEDDFPGLKCPHPYCYCPLDEKGRRLVICSKGGLEDPLPLLDMPEDMEILIVNATDEENYNSLTLGPIFKRHQKLEEIHLTHSNIPAIGAHSFWGLRKLKVLNVSNNVISALISTDLRGPEFLNVLDLSHNIIESIPSAAFRHINKLQILDLSHNKIPELVPKIFFGLDRLVTLDISYNAIGGFQYDIFSDTPMLETLNCVNCGISGITSNVLLQLKHLKHLNLNHNRLTQLPSMSLIPRLHSLYLEGNHIPHIQQGALFGLVLRKLSLGHNNIKRIDTNAFTNTTVMSLDLSYNKFKNFDPVVLDPIIMRIKELFLSGNSMTDDKLLLFLPNARQLRKLGLGDCGLTYISPQILKRSRYLKNLNISGNLLTNISPDLLATLPNLHILDLSFNRFTGLMQEVSESFIAVKSLTKIRLEGNPWICEECEIIHLVHWLKNSRHQPNSLNACHKARLSNLCLKCSSPNSLEGEDILLLNEEQIPPCSPSTEWVQWLNDSSDPIVSVSITDKSYADPLDDSGTYSAFFKDHLALLVGVGCGLVLALLLVVVFALAVYKKQTAMYYAECKVNEQENEDLSDKLVGRNNNDSPVILPVVTDQRKLSSTYTPMAISLVHARNPITKPTVETTYNAKISPAMDTIEEA